MSTVLKNFVTIRKNRGDVLRPAEFRSIVEMIRGILRQYDYSGFNEAYQEFMDHLANHHDPHKVTQTSFAGQIIERTYDVYVKMTQFPLTREQFDETIVPTLGFLELIRRIALNRYLYNQVKNTDGSVPQTATVYLSEDWGHNVRPNVPITLSFGSPLADENAFLTKGWETNPNTTPIRAIFNASNLTLDLPQSSVIFHTSSSSPYFNVDGGSSGYPISLFGSSNDFSIDLSVTGSPTTKTTLLSMLNGTVTFTIAMTPTRAIELKFGSTVLVAAQPCIDGHFTLKMRNDGFIQLTVVNNGVITISNYMVDFSTTVPFISGIIGAPMESLFNSTFGIRELNITKDTYTIVPDDTVIPMIAHLPASLTTPLTGTANAPGATAAFTPDVGYNLYLTLTGTWTGQVRVQRSVDNGLNWTTVTTGGGNLSGEYIRNCDEAVLKVTDTRARYRLQFNIATGTVIYRLGQ